MNWMFYALLAPAIYAIVTYVDKYILEKEINDYNALPLFTSCIAFIAGCIFFIITGAPIIPLRDTLLILTTGILSSLSLIVYARALSLEETSKVNALMQMFPIISLVLSFLILKEVITLKQFLGFIIILSSTIGFSFKKEKKGFSLSKGFFLMLIFDILWAISGIIMKFVIRENSFSEVLSYESFGIAFGGVLIFIFYKTARKAFLKSLKNIKFSAIRAISINETTFVVAKATTFYAFSLGPVALVSVLEGTQTFFALFYGWILTLLFPSVFKEDISKKGLSKKLILFVLLFLGLVLLK